MWDGINALHVPDSYLDPSLKGFTFLRDAKERRSLLEQAVSIVKENTMPIAKELIYPPPPKESEDSDVEVLGKKNMKEQTGD